MISFIIYVILSSMGIILFKLGASDASISLTKGIFNFHMSYISMIGLLCYLLSFILWMYIIANKNVSYIVPLGLGLTNVMILVGSYFILGESISLMNIVGAGVILVGVMIISM
ncbi:hypothetical protein ACWN8P_06310 [Vagococcus salmoninarum]|uniref:EamA domain-containing protein n=1 Tax=Vagococcus salmoninarum TaxID=2739 RepID=A0A429ZPZ8_9ENTE|nr:hypothetical protein [Vagococcus salmoninarum]RST95709.1 hypothetical protein CBF35_06990 [Vagococcus salmoninarum]